MNAKYLVALLITAAVSLFAGQGHAAPKATVIVCIEGQQQVLIGVRPLAGAMFASIGVRIDWREQDSCPAGVGAVQVRLSHDPPCVRNSQALAFSRPYKNTIVVFLSRVQLLDRYGASAVMAHVLVHEITHILQGIDRHSDTGIMKAHWSNYDCFQMGYKPLPFAPEDVNLIYQGLRARGFATVTAVNPAMVAGQ